MSALPKKLADRVWFWDDERKIGNSLIVTLVPGFKFETDPLGNSHVEGFDTVRDAQRAVKYAIPCQCAECLEAMQPQTVEDA